MLTIPAHVHWGRCSGSVAVLNLRTGQWQMFSGVGAHIWDVIALRGSTAGLAEEIAAPADVPTPRAAVGTYVTTLIELGLLTEAAGQPRKKRWWQR